MAKISTTKKIAIEDFPKETKSWIGKLIDPINRFFEQVYFALSKGITTSDNLKAQKYDLLIEAGQTYPLKVSWQVNERPTLVLVGQIGIYQGTGSVGVYGFEWTYDNNSLLLTFTSLDSAKKYRVTVVGIV